MAPRSPEHASARRRPRQFRIRALLLTVFGSALAFALLTDEDVGPMLSGLGAAALALAGLGLGIFLGLMTLGYLGFLAFDAAGALVALVRRAGSWPAEEGGMADDDS
jgi:hypothetical protein